MQSQKKHQIENVNQAADLQKGSRPVLSQTILWTPKTVTKDHSSKMPQVLSLTGVQLVKKSPSIPVEQGILLRTC